MKSGSFRSVYSVLLLAIMIGCAGFARAETVTSAFSKAAPGSRLAVDHSAWSALLARYVVPGADAINRVRYTAWKADGLAGLDRYLAALEAVDVAALAPLEQAAFWINLYNAKTAAIVLSRYPVKSIRDINLPLPSGEPGDGPWKAKVTSVGGVSLSLDEIENEIVRKVFKDARMHYALNCLSIGCPNLLGEAYTGERLEAQLEQASRAFVNHSRGISFAGGKVRACSIYEWFASDFGTGKFADVIAHLQRYAEPALKEKLATVTAIDEYHYDWTLNDAVD